MSLDEKIATTGMVRLGQTPSQTVGPFFHLGMIRGNENLLVSEETLGQRITVTGAVVDGEGEPVSDAAIEIWQADSNGIFNHPEDPFHQEADPNFPGFGRAQTGSDGTYSFYTVKPGVHESAVDVAQNQRPRVPYINLRVFARGLLIHAVTRAYFSDEVGTDGDPIYSLVDPQRRHTLVAQLETSTGESRYRFDIRLQGEGETVFFDL